MFIFSFIKKKGKRQLANKQEAEHPPIESEMYMMRFGKWSNKKTIENTEKAKPALKNRNLNLYP